MRKGLTESSKMTIRVTYKSIINSMFFTARIEVPNADVEVIRVRYALPEASRYLLENKLADPEDVINLYTDENTKCFNDATVKHWASKAYSEGAKSSTVKQVAYVPFSERQKA